MSASLYTAVVGMATDDASFCFPVSLLFFLSVSRTEGTDSPERPEPLNSVRMAKCFEAKHEDSERPVMAEQWL